MGGPRRGFLYCNTIFRRYGAHRNRLRERPVLRPPLLRRFADGAFQRKDLREQVVDRGAQLPGLIGHLQKLGPFFLNTFLQFLQLPLLRRQFLDAPGNQVLKLLGETASLLPVYELRKLVRKADAPNIRFRRRVLHSLPS